MTYQSANIPAVVLAGGPAAAFAPGRQPQKKALLRYSGRPSIDYVLDALRQVPRIQRIGVAGMSEKALKEVKGAGDCDILPLTGGTMTDHVFGALRHYASEPAVLFATADAPLVSAGSVTAFLDRLPDLQGTHGRAIYFPVVPATCFTGIYRRVPKPFFRSKDAAVSHGNLAVLDTSMGTDRTLKKRLDGMYKHRKNLPASILSVSPLAGALLLLHALLFFRAISLQTLARLISKSLDIDLHPVVVPHPGITVDADEPEDYLFIKTVLEGHVQRNHPG